MDLPHHCASCNASVYASRCSRLQSLRPNSRSREVSVIFFVVFLAVALNVFFPNSDVNFKLRQQALMALAQISRWPDGAAAVVEAQVTAKATQLLYDPHPKIRAETSRILGNLALHATTVAAVVSIEPCARLVSFLRYLRYTFI